MFKGALSFCSRPCLRESYHFKTFFNGFKSFLLRPFLSSSYPFLRPALRVSYTLFKAVFKDFLSCFQKSALGLPSICVEMRFQAFLKAFVRPCSRLFKAFFKAQTPVLGIPTLCFKALLGDSYLFR